MEERSRDWSRRSTLRTGSPRTLTEETARNVQYGRQSEPAGWPTTSWYDRAVIDTLGAQLQVARDFVAEWYGWWRDETGQRRTFAEAQSRYVAWQTKPAYQAIAPLRRVQARMTAGHFERLSQFLRHPDWEATNNGAERAGRAFRHRQAPHFNLRTPATIEGAVIVAACQHKAAATAPAAWPLHTCQRGRKRRMMTLPAMLICPG